MAKEQESIDTVWKAAAYGDFDVLTRLSSADPDSLHRPDDQGFYALQWAALNNRVAVLNYLLGAGCDPHTTDPSGQTALHWAAVRGSVPAAETLLRAGAPLGACDGRGYSVAHVAAQYGQTAMLLHLAQRWGADMDVPDSDGRTPLHWAAYKGHSDALRLLLVAGADAARPDAEGCTPLHWAAIRGNAEACTLLVQGGAGDCLGLPDATGATPSQLAADKGHRALALVLAEARTRHEKSTGKRIGGGGGVGYISLSGIATRITSLHLAPVIWAIVLCMLAVLARCVVRNPRLPSPSAATLALMYLCFALACAGLFYLYKTTTADPGLLPLGPGAPAASIVGPVRRRSSPRGLCSNAAPRAKDEDEEQGVEMHEHAHLRGGTGRQPGGLPGGLASPALAAGNWGQLCVACRIVRPLRAKHCGVTGRCIELFDHYCPWVGNAIGAGNRWSFIVFLWLELGAVIVAMVVAGIRLHTALGIRSGLSMQQPDPTRLPASAVAWPVGFIVADAFLLLSLAALALAQANQAARNVTTNELANWHRYKYMHDEEGEFFNPFDKGWRANCAEAWSPRPPRAVYVLPEAGAKDSIV